MYYHLQNSIFLAPRLNFCTETISYFYVLPSTRPNSQHLQTEIVLIFEEAFCHERMFYVLCITIYRTIILLDEGLKQFDNLLNVYRQWLEVRLETHYVLL